MTALWDKGTDLTDAVQASTGQEFSSYLPLIHAAPTPYRNQGYQSSYTSPGPNAPHWNTIVYNAINPPQYRPWINDPCRAIWDETAKLWRAYVLTSNNPDTTDQTWLEMVSPDLHTWVNHRLPFYLGNLDIPTLWGGSFVIDKTGTAGFGKGAVIYLISVPGGEGNTYQSVARFVAPKLGMAPVYDKIVLPNPGPGDIVHAPGMDFRDPRVDWDEAHHQWVMKLTVDYGIAFYRSDDLESWTFLSVIDLTPWRQVETPDLVPMTASDGTPKWVLFFCLKTWNNQPHAGVAYMVGAWDGTTFTPDDPTPTLLNHGADYYAQAIFQKDGNTYCWAWMGNWLYSFELPTQGFAGNQSLVTQLTLVPDKDKIGTFRLSIDTLPLQDRGYPSYVQYWQALLSADGTTEWQPDLSNPGVSWRVDMALVQRSPQAWSDSINFDFCIGANTHTRLSLSPNQGTVTLSRANAGQGPLKTDDTTAATLWAQDCIAPLPNRKEYDVSVIFDVSAVEIIINNTLYLSSLIFPPDDAFGMKLTHVGNGATILRSFKLSC